jgi:hypothetical protein
MVLKATTGEVGICKWWISDNTLNSLRQAVSPAINDNKID